MNTAAPAPSAALAAIVASVAFDEMVEVNRDLFVTSRELGRANARHACGEVVLGLGALRSREARAARQLHEMLRTAAAGDLALGRALAAEVSRVATADEVDVL